MAALDKDSCPKNLCLAKWQNGSKSQFPQLQNGVMQVFSTLLSYWALNKTTHVKNLWQCPRHSTYSQVSCHYNFYFKIFFLMKTILKVLLICYNIASNIYVGFFLASEACSILVPWPGFKPTHSALEGEVQIPGAPGTSSHNFNFCCHFLFKPFPLLNFFITLSLCFLKIPFHCKSTPLSLKLTLRCVFHWFCGWLL